jgi:hypothetical protein
MNSATVYCGASSKIPVGKRVGTMEECVKLGKISLYGLNKIDLDVLNEKKENKDKLANLEKNILDVKKKIISNSVNIKKNMQYLQYAKGDKIQEYNDNIKKLKDERVEIQKKRQELETQKEKSDDIDKIEIKKQVLQRYKKKKDEDGEKFMKNMEKVDYITRKMLNDAVDVLNKIQKQDKNIVRNNEKSNIDLTTIQYKKLLRETQREQRAQRQQREQMEQMEQMGQREGRNRDKEEYKKIMEGIQGDILSGVNREQAIVLFNKVYKENEKELKKEKANLKRKETIRKKKEMQKTPIII